MEYVNVKNTTGNWKVAVFGTASIWVPARPGVDFWNVFNFFKFQIPVVLARGFCVAWCCGGGHVKWCHEVAKACTDRIVADLFMDFAIQPIQA